MFSPRGKIRTNFLNRKFGKNENFAKNFRSSKIWEIKILILAGGFATRLWPLTESRAKPLLLLNGETILAKILAKIPPNLEIFLLTNKKFAPDFHAEIKNLQRKNVQIFCEDSFSDNEKLGALGAVSTAIKNFEIKENIAIFAGDNLLENFNFSQILCGENEAKILVREAESFFAARKFGVAEIDSQNFVKNFSEKPAQPKSKLISTGFCAIGQNFFSILHDFAAKNPDALGAIFTEFLRHKKKIRAEKINGQWFDVGSFSAYLAAHKFFQQQKNEKIIKKINFKKLAKNFKIEKKIDEKKLKKICEFCEKNNFKKEILEKKIAEKFGIEKKIVAKILENEKITENKNLKIEKNFFAGQNFIGKNCQIKNSKILNSIIYPNTKIENCQISESVIDENCVLRGIDINQKLIRKNTNLQF